MTNDTARSQILAIRERDPDASTSDLAREIGVTRQRIAQLIRHMGLPKGRRTYQERTGKPAARVRTGGVECTISHTVAGTIGELLAAADLMARGFMVFFPLTRTGACDLIILDRDGHTERIEVRCGKRLNGRLTYSQADRSRSDRRAIVLTGEPVEYEPSFEPAPIQAVAPAGVCTDEIHADSTS